MPEFVSASRLRLVVFFALATMALIGVSKTGATTDSSSRGSEDFRYADAFSQQASPGEKTVEQVQKNIKVLNGLPQSQLIPVMNFISSSLGVKCNFCHVNKDGKWDFPSDEKPEKGTAREMIQMVQSVNKTTFRGANEVSCYTCHRGRSHPVSVPPLPIPEPVRPSAEASSSPAASPAPAETRLTADQILAKYHEALGGSAAIEKLKTRTMKGTWITSNGISLGYEVYQSGPDKLYTVLNTPRQGMIERGFDGMVGWEQSTRGLRDLTGDELAFLRRYPDLFSDIKLKEQFTSLTGPGKDKIDGRDVNVLRGTTTSGKREPLYFDSTTGLLVRRIILTPTPVGIIPEQVDFDDYRDVDGLKMPFKMRVSTVDPNQSSTRQFTEIRLNLAVDESKFKKPAAKPVVSPSP